MLAIGLSVVADAKKGLWENEGETTTRTATTTTTTATNLFPVEKKRIFPHATSVQLSQISCRR